MKFTLFIFQLPWTVKLAKTQIWDVGFCSCRDIRQKRFHNYLYRKSTISLEICFMGLTAGQYDWSISFPDSQQYEWKPDFQGCHKIPLVKSSFAKRLQVFLSIKMDIKTWVGLWKNVQASVSRCKPLYLGSVFSTRNVLLFCLMLFFNLVLPFGKKV